MPVVPILAILWVLAEIALFIQVGGLIGLGPTLLVVLLSAVLGIALLRHQGLRTLREAEATIRRGEPPLREMIEGLCVVAGGGLLILPGFLSDAVGLLLLVPPLRGWLGGALWRTLERRGMVWEATVRIDSLGRRRSGPGPEDRVRRPPPADVIEGEFREVEEPPEEPGGKDVPPLSDSRWGRDRPHRP